jgi:O-antigen ligase
MKTLFSWNYKFGVSFLLVLGLLLHGAKTPITFFFWSMAALASCGIPLAFRPLETTIQFHWELLFLACILVSQLFSQDPSASIFATTQALVYWLIWVALKTHSEFFKSERWFWRTTVALGTLSFMITGLQILHGQWRQAYGFLPINPSFNAIWMASLAVAFLGSPKSGIGRKVQWPLAVLLIAMVILGPSRQTVMALTVGLGYLLLPQINSRRIVGLVLAVILILCLVPNRILETRLRLNEGNYRSHFWGIALRALLEKPVTGYGLGNFEMVYQRHAFPVDTDTIRFARSTNFAHNELLQIGSEMGVPAMGIALMVIGILITLRPANQRATKAGLLVLLASAMTTIVWHMPLLLYLTLIYSAVVWHVAREPTMEMKTYRFSPWARGMITALMGGVILQLSWQALRQHWAAQQRWDLILRGDSRDALAWQNWAYHQSLSDQALLGFAQAVRLSPSQVYFHESYARALESAPHPDLALALKEYLLALRCAPGRATNALAIGRILFRLRDPQEAVSWFQRARYIEPHFWECDLWLARCRYQLGNQRAAIWILRNLEQRRKKYLEERARIVNDLPSGNDPSDYEHAILAYDSHVVERQLLWFLSSKGNVLIPTSYTH